MKCDYEPQPSNLAMPQTTANIALIYRHYQVKEKPKENECFLQAKIPWKWNIAQLVMQTGLELERNSITLYIRIEYQKQIIN